MATVQTAEKPNFDTVWATLQEIAASQKEYELKREKDREEFNIRLGSLTNLFGDLTLGMVAPKLRDKFADLGLVFPKTYLNAYVQDRINKISFETDITLENGDKAMLVEVKTKLTIERINKHIERLEKMRKHADLHGDKRTFLGAVAGFAITDEVRDLALQEGLYVIEPDGENFNITTPSGEAKEW